MVEFLLCKENSWASLTYDETQTWEWYKRVIHYFTLYFTERQYDDMTAMEEKYPLQIICHLEIILTV